MRLGEAEKVLKELDSQFEIRKAVKESMIDLPSNDSVQLFSKFATPESFQDDELSVTRENATSNLAPKQFDIIVMTGSIRSNFIHFKKVFLDEDALNSQISNETDMTKKKEEQAELLDIHNANKWIDNLIRMIGDDITIRATTSKGLNGWLGGLIISSKKLTEITTGNIKEGAKRAFGLGRGG